MQRGQAPWGELKEKIRGSSSGIEVPQGQANFSEKTRVPADSRTPQRAPLEKARSSAARGRRLGAGRQFLHLNDALR